MIDPRPYQTEAVQATVDASARGVQRVLVALPTGTGKTVVFALLLQQRGGRSLVLAHRAPCRDGGLALRNLGYCH
jgi:superfamily II DNA or RNA helicase